MANRRQTVEKLINERGKRSNARGDISNTLMTRPITKETNAARINPQDKSLISYPSIYDY
jgi:hypothetical protein